jgi:hypothetical protein
VPYETLAKTLPSIGDFNQLMEDTPPMRTNQLPDATKENLAVYLN